MPWHTVFISHSTKTPEAETYRREICDALRMNEIKVLVDEEGLRGGDCWKEKLYRWMAKAHGAVLILSEEALTSEFVSIEASVLAWRSFLQRDFVFVPVIIGKVTYEDASRGIIGELCKEVHFVEGETPQAIARKVVESFQELIKRRRPKTLRQKLEAEIVDYMKRASMDEAAADEIGEEFLGWTFDMDLDGLDRLERLARDLLDQDTQTAYDIIIELNRRHRVRDAHHIMDIVTPFWVSENAATPLAQLALDIDYDKRALSLHSLEDWTVNSYISRSCFLKYAHKLPVCEIEPPRLLDSFADIKEQIRTYLRDRTGVDYQDLEKIKAHIQGNEDHNVPVFLLFRWLPDDQLLRELRREFKTVTFFILTGNTQQEMLVGFSNLIHELEPPDGTMEQRTKTAYEVVQPLVR